MSRNVTVDFAEDAGPTLEQAGFVLDDFFNGAAGVWRDPDSEANYDTFFVLLPGLPKSPMARVWPSNVFTVQAQEKRWIEVFWAAGQVTFTTRMQDEYTNALAVALAEVFARRWKGKVQS